MKKVAIIQSNYLPWKGYFDIIHDVDTFVFYDDLQFTVRDWRNRNRIKTPRGAEWMTVPVGANRDRLMCDVELTDASWQARHLDLLRMHYRKTLHFPDYWPFVEDFLGKRVWTNLSELNHYLITTIARDFLGIGTQFLDSRNFVREGHKLSRLVSLVRQSGADIYISGPAARDYIDPAAFEAEGIELVYKSYADYPEYPQMFPPFEHGVTILDLLFNVGQDAPYYIWGWRESACARERSPPGSRMEQAS